MNLTKHDIVLDTQLLGATGEDTVYPFHYTGECLTVPSLDLGRSSVPAERR